MDDIRIPIPEPVRVDVEREAVELLARPKPPERDGSGGYEIAPPHPESGEGG